MQRRHFLVGGAAATAAAVGAAAVVTDRRFTPDFRRRYGDVVVERRPPDPDAPDVLFVSLDDCNDWLGFLNDHPGTSTPNLDALAAESVVFEHAYCTAPMCLPSRTSVMFGTTPYHNGVYDHTEPSDQRYAELSRRSTSLVDDFWAAGYEVVVAGKVFGNFPATRFDQGRRTRIVTPDPDWQSPFGGSADSVRGGQIDFGPSGNAPEEEPDGQAAQWVRHQLSTPRPRPLFLGYGLISTHLAWRVPQRYFDLHPLDEVVVPDVPADDLDDLGPAARELIDSRTGNVLERRDLTARAVQAYQAAISYADDRLGVVLDTLASSPRGAETVVVLWSDHGFHLGEKLHWQKFTLWERATRVPMLFRVPGRPAQRFEPPVSTLDIGPTLAAIAGVPVLGAHDGASLLPALDDPARATARPAITTWLPGNHAVRQGPWRYIRYRGGEEELYDHREDPGELRNLGRDPGLAQVRTQLAAFLPEPGEQVDLDRPPQAGAAD